MIGYFIFRLLVGLTYFIPFWFLHRLADLTAWLLHRVFRYRLKVVRANMRRVFPDKSEAELREIERKFYTNLADVMWEGLKGVHLSLKEIARRFPILHVEDYVNPYTRSGRSILCAGGHFGNWEWGALGPGSQIEGQCVVIFKTVNNRRIHDYVVRSRSRFGSQMVSTRETRLAFQRNEIDKPTPSVYLMLADQYPSNQTDAHRVPFFGETTTFLHGPAKYAWQYDLPLFFIEHRRVKRGFYEIWVSPLVLNPRDYEPEALTAIYAKKVEQTIREQPENWLWTHKRWKQ